MKTPRATRPRRSLLRLVGAVSMIALAACMDRDPAAPPFPAPQFVAWGSDAPCSATGSADIDGYLNEAAWGTACTTPFTADLTGDRSTMVTARSMNDAGNVYFSAVSNAPFSNPNSVLRVFLQSSTGSLHAVGIVGNAPKQWTCTSLSSCTELASVPTGAAAIRQNSAGATAYEIAWPLAELFGGLAAGNVVAVRWETIPGGNASPTLFPAATADPLQVQISGEASVNPNDPALPDIVITTDYAATVTIRNPNADPFLDLAAFQCKIAQPNGIGGFTARFNDLPVGTQWVGTAGNKKTCNHLIWPPEDPTYTPDFSLPGQQGAVYNEDNASSLPLTWANWLTAKGNAVPLGTAVVDDATVGDVREWYIVYQGNGRTSSCTAINGDGTTVYVLEPGNNGAIPASPNRPPPGLALTYAPRTACTVSGLSLGTTLVFQMRNLDGGESTGVLPASAGSGTTVTLFRQSNLQGSTLVTDDPGDGSPVDLRMLSYGPVENGDGVLTGQFSILASFQGWNEKKKEAQVAFDVVLDPGTSTAQTIQVTAFYLDQPTKTRAKGWTIDVSPSNQAGRVALGSAAPTTSPTTGQSFNGGVEILINSWSTVIEAQIRVRANLSGGSMDFMPNSGYSVWPGANGGSFASPF